MKKLVESLLIKISYKPKYCLYIGNRLVKRYGGDSEIC